MTTHWTRAAQSYLAANQTKENGGVPQTEIDAGTAELEGFMRNEGAAAMELLRASNRHINLAVTDAESGFCEVYLLDKGGLQMVTEAAGMGAALSKTKSESTFTGITPRQAIEAAVEIGHKKATEVVAYLRSELDRIATAAPKSA